MAKFRRSGLELLKLGLNCVLDSHVGPVASTVGINWKGVYTSCAMSAMDIISMSPGRGRGEGGADVERGCRSLFKGEDIKIKIDGSQRLRYVSSQFFWLRSLPVFIRHSLMKSRNLCWGVRLNGLRGRGLRSTTH
jgi:hypothetical protein